MHQEKSYYSMNGFVSLSTNMQEKRSFEKLESEALEC